MLHTANSPNQNFEFQVSTTNSSTLSVERMYYVVQQRYSNRHSTGDQNERKRADSTGKQKDTALYTGTRHQVVGTVLCFVFLIRFRPSTKMVKSTIACFCTATACSWCRSEGRDVTATRTRQSAGKTSAHHRQHGTDARCTIVRSYNMNTSIVAVISYQ